MPKSKSVPFKKMFYLYFCFYNKSTEMIQNIKEVFKSNLETIEWMDSSTKDYARRKVNNI